MKEKRKTEVVGKFSTPIWTGLVDNIEETNKDLKDYINKYEYCAIVSLFFYYLIITR